MGKNKNYYSTILELPDFGTELIYHLSKNKKKTALSCSVMFVIWKDDIAYLRKK